MPLNLFTPTLLPLQHIVGPLIDQRHVVLYKQPDTDVDDLLRENFLNTIQADTSTSDSTYKTLEYLVKRSSLTELFTGTKIALLSQINGYNAFGISYMSADVDINSELCEHPVENGTVITDHAILNPVSASVRINMPTAYYTRIYEQIFSMYKEKTKILLQTKFSVYKNMVIEAMPYKQENATVDRPEIELKLKQVVETAPARIMRVINSNTTTTPSAADTVDYGREYASEVRATAKKDVETVLKKEDGGV